METEVHVYGFGIAANVLLSFFPFLVTVICLFRYVLHLPAAADAVYFGLRDYFPGETGEFLVRNLRAAAYNKGAVPWFSVLLVFFSANGIFEPLEVALNRIWNAHGNRSFWSNQIISMVLIFVCGGLLLLGLVLTGINRQFVTGWLGNNFFTQYISLLVFKAVALVTTVLALFSIYWLLPNRRIHWLQVLPVAIVVGIILEALKYVLLLLYPWLHGKVREEYGVFENSAMLLLLSFAASMIVLAGAEWAARIERMLTGRMTLPDATTMRLRRP